MKLIFSLTLAWVLHRTATSLWCHTCVDQLCSQTASKICSSETMCITATLLGTPLIYKDCASSSLCPATGSMTASVNLGSQSATASAECCSADYCNSQTLPPPPTQSPNILQCIACDSTISECNTTITCSGNETNCFKATATNGNTRTLILGCATPNICSSLGSLLFMPIIGSFTSEPTCCATNLCNDPRTTTTTTTTATTPTTINTPATTTTTTPTTVTTTTPTTVTTPTTATSDASNFRLGLLHLILGIFIFII